VAVVDPTVFLNVISSFIINHFLPTYFSIHLCVSGQLRSIWTTTSSPRQNSHVGIYLSALPSEEACRTHILTNCSSQVRARGDDTRSAGPEDPYLCLTPMFITAFTNTSQCTLILSQMQTVHTAAPYLSIIFMTHYSVMLPSKPVSPILSLPFVSLLLLWFEYTAYLLHSTIFPIRDTRPAHFIHTVIIFRGRCDDR
jgi:hypothetical protein